MRISEEQLNTSDQNGNWKGWWEQVPASATIAAVGLPAPTLNNSPTTFYGTGVTEYLAFATAPSAGAYAGVNGPSNITRFGTFQVMTTTIQTAADITATRICVGLFNVNPATSDTQTAPTLGFRYSTAADGTAFWRVMTGNGITTTITATAVAIAPSTRYVLTIDASTVGVVQFLINGVLAASLTASLPNPTNGLTIWVSVTGLTSTAKTIYFRKCLVELL